MLDKDPDWWKDVKDNTEMGQLRLLLIEVQDIKRNHLHHIPLLYERLGAVEADGRWIVRLMWGATVIGLGVLAGVLTLVAKGVG